MIATPTSTTLPIGLSGELCPPLVRTVAAHGLAASALDEWPVAPLGADEWVDLVALVDEHRLWSMLADAIASGSMPTTASQADLVRRHDTEAVLTCLHLDRALVALHRRVAARGIEIRFFKGVTTALGFYAEPGLRNYSDIDLLVRDTDLDRLIEVLVGEGAERMGTSRWSGVRLADGWEIDLHQSLRHGPFGAAIPAGELFEPHATLAIADAMVPTLTLPALFVAACFNVILPNDLRKLSPLRDVAEMLASGRLDDAEVLALAERWRCSVVVGAAVRTAAELFALDPTSPLVPWARAFVPSPRERRWLATYHDTSPRHVFKQVWHTTTAYPSRRDGARFVWRQVFHEGRDPLAVRVRHLRQRLDLPGSSTTG